MQTRLNNLNGEKFSHALPEIGEPLSEAIANGHLANKESNWSEMSANTDSAKKLACQKACAKSHYRRYSKNRY